MKDFQVNELTDEEQKMHYAIFLEQSGADAVDKVKQMVIKIGTEETLYYLLKAANKPSSWPQMALDHLWNVVLYIHREHINQS